MALYIALFLTIAAAIAVGSFIVYAAVITLRWLKNKARELMAKKNVKKVAALELEKLIAECPNQKDLSALYDDDYDMVLAAVDAKGKLEGNIEVVKNSSAYMDSDLKEELGREHMVVYG